MLSDKKKWFIGDHAGLLISRISSHRLDEKIVKY